MLILPTERVVRVSSQFEECGDCVDNEGIECKATQPMSAFVTENGDLYIGHYNEQTKGALYKIKHEEKVMNAVIFMHHLIFLSVSHKLFIQTMYDCKCSCIEKKHSSDSVMSDITAEKNEIHPRTTEPPRNGDPIDSDLRYKFGNDIAMLTVEVKTADRENVSVINHIYTTARYLFFISETNSLNYISRSDFLETLNNYKQLSYAERDLVLSTDSLTGLEDKKLVQIASGPNYLSFVTESKELAKDGDILASESKEMDSVDDSIPCVDNSQCLCDQCTLFIHNSNFFEENLSSFIQDFNVNVMSEANNFSESFGGNLGTSFVRSRSREKGDQFPLLQFKHKKKNIADMLNKGTDKDIELLNRNESPINSNENSQNDGYFGTLSNNSMLSYVASGIGGYVNQITRQLQQSQTYLLPNPTFECDQINTETYNTDASTESDIVKSSSSDNSPTKYRSDVSCDVQHTSDDITSESTECQELLNSDNASNDESNSQGVESEPKVSASPETDFLDKLSSQETSSVDQNEFKETLLLDSGIESSGYPSKKVIVQPRDATVKLSKNIHSLELNNSPDLLKLGQSFKESEVHVLKCGEEMKLRNLTQLSHYYIVKIINADNYLVILQTNGRVLFFSLEENKDNEVHLLEIDKENEVIGRDISCSGDRFLYIVSQCGDIYVKDMMQCADEKLPFVVQAPPTSSVMCAGDNILLNEASDISPKMSAFITSEIKYLSLMLSARENLFSNLVEYCSDKTDIVAPLERSEVADTLVEKEVVLNQSCLLCKAQIRYKTPTFKDAIDDFTENINELTADSLQETHIKVLQTLLQKLDQLIDVLNISIRQLIYLLNHNNGVISHSFLPIVSNCNSFCEVYASYIDSLNDAIAMGILQFTCKQFVNIILKSAENLTNLMPDFIKDSLASLKCKQVSIFERRPSDLFKQLSDRRDKKSKEGLSDEHQTSDEFNAHLIFDWFLKRPLERIVQYEDFLSSQTSLENIHHKWRQLSLLAIKSENEASKSKNFWNSWINLPASVYSPKQRILLDSRDFGSIKFISLSNGKFMNNFNLASPGYLVLLSDTLLHCLPSTHVIYRLKFVWVNSDDSAMGLMLNLPEEKLSLTFSSVNDKKTWLKEITDAIRSCCQKNEDGVLNGWQRICTLSKRNVTANVFKRYFKYEFSKHQQYKGAKYSGHWEGGQLEGSGTLKRSDGSVYKGSFSKGLYHGSGTLTRQSTSLPNCKDVLSGATFIKGHWLQGKLHGWAHIRYNTGDAYTGWVADNLLDVYGSVKKGFSGSSEASIYTGGFRKGMRDGYGVEDNVWNGSKYMGGFKHGERSGHAVVVTTNGAYYEGVFVGGRALGTALVVMEDGVVYEGEVTGSKSSLLELVSNGKGVLYYQNGERIEGSFTGSLITASETSQVLKISSALLHRGLSGNNVQSSKKLGSLSCSINTKWHSLFELYENLLKNINSDEMFSGDSSLTIAHLVLIHSYLDKAFSVTSHPLAQLLTHIVTSFRATYGSITGSPGLILPHALQEVKHCTLRLYNVIRILFPILPAADNILKLQAENEETIFVTPATVVHTWLLPQLYSALSTLYLLCADAETPEATPPPLQFSYPHPPTSLCPSLLSGVTDSFLPLTEDPSVNHPLHRTSCRTPHSLSLDRKYWRNLCAWNLLPDYNILHNLDVGRRCSSPTPVNVFKLTKGQLFSEAIEIFQMITTSFLPRAKLTVVQLTFRIIQKMLQDTRICSLDALFPVFVYVIVRSRVQRLGVEITLMRDLIDHQLKLGELDYIYTNLTAAYFHICEVEPPTN